VAGHQQLTLAEPQALTVGALLGAGGGQAWAMVWPALLLTCAAYGPVWLRLPSGRTALYAVAGIGFVQMLVHFRSFLHVDVERNARADLYLLLFSAADCHPDDWRHARTPVHLRHRMM
jgi:hypothetical protein